LGVVRRLREFDPDRENPAVLDRLALVDERGPVVEPAYRG